MKTSLGIVICFTLCLSNVQVNAQLPEIDFYYIPGLPLYCRAQDIVRDHDGMLWFAHLSAGEGIFVYDGVFLHQIKADRSDPVSLTDAEVQDMMVAPDGRIWVSTLNRGICVYDPKTDHFTHIDLSAITGVPDLHSQNIYPSADDVLWVASFSGLLRYNDTDSSWTRFPIDASVITMPTEDPEGVLEKINLIRHICPDPIHSSRLWLGTVFGLVSFDTRTQTYEHHAMPYSAKEEVDRATEQYLIMDIVFVSPTKLIAGTWGGGLLEYDIPENAWSRYRDPNVNPTQDVYWDLEFLDSTRIWVNSMAGFGVFALPTASFAYYDSIPTPHPFTQHLWFTSAMEQINAREIAVLGSNGGVMVQLAEQPVDWTLYPPLVRQIRIDDKPVPPTNNRYSRRYQKLGAGEERITLTIVAPIFHDQDAVLYRYALTGDDRWHTCPGGRIEIEGLAPGRNELRFQASLDSLAWIDGEVWTIEKFVPVWQSRGLKLVIGGCLAAGILLYLLLVRRQRRKRSILEHSFKHMLAESEISALRAQMNPHFIFNSLNSIKMYVMKQETKMANHYLTRFSHLMRLILRHSKSKLISLEEELRALRLYTEIEQLRFDDAFKTEFKVSDDIEPEDYYIPPMLMQPYVENAIWHGLMHFHGNGILQIAIARQDEQLRIVIEDNGVGRAAARSRDEQDGVLKKSYGTQITRDRIELIKQSLGIKASVAIDDLFDNNGKPAGTRVVLMLPCITSARAMQLMQEERPIASS